MPGPIQRRKAFTLIELLVVIGIMVALLALTGVYFVSFRPAEQAQRGADQLAGWILSARQQARRDGRPTGIRLMYLDPKTNQPAPVPANATTPAVPPFATGVLFIQQPDDFALGVYTGQWTPPTPPFPRNSPAVPNVAQIQYQPNPNQAVQTVLLYDGTPNQGKPQGLFPVQAGDYLEINGGGVLRRIINFPGTNPATPILPANPRRPRNGVYRLCLAPTPPAPSPLPRPPTYAVTDYTGVDLPNVGTVTPTQTNYRIIPQPAGITGEAVRWLPDGVAIDLSTQTWNTAFSPNGALSNPPTRFDQPDNVVAFEILFAPSGAVIGKNSGTGMTWLWVRNLNPQNSPNNQVDNQNDPEYGRPLLVTIQSRTGFIAQHPVASGGGNPYSFARDGTSSGM